MSAVSDGDGMPGKRGKPAPGHATSVGTHYLRYSSANVLILLAGLVSFPILTRLLDNTQYGILGYYETWIALAVAVVKFGSQHSVMRFYPHGADATGLAHFATNMVLFPLIVSLSTWAVAVAVFTVLQTISVLVLPTVFWCALMLIPLVVVSSLMDIVLQASERSMLLTVTRVCKRWLELALILLAIFLYQRSALAVYFGKLATGVLVVGFYVQWLYRNFSFSRELLDRPAIQQSLIYGLPLVANEIAWVLLDSIDRVMLKHITGDFAAVGVYTIGYSLAMNVRLFMNSTLLEAFVPVANRLYGSEGDAAVRALKDRILLPMTYASIGAAALLVGAGQDALVALSGPGKAASGEVFIVVGVTFALYPLISVSNFGLLLRKRSMTVFSASLGAAGLNILLNLLLIPAYGVMGAVWASVISYAALAIINSVLCPAGLFRFPRPRSVLIACVCAAVLLLTMRLWQMFGVEPVWTRLFIAGWLFACLYLAPVWLLDPQLRDAVRSWRSQPA